MPHNYTKNAGTKLSREMSFFCLQCTGNYLDPLGSL